MNTDSRKNRVSTKGPIKYNSDTRYYLEGLLKMHEAEAIRYRSILPNCFIIGAAKSGTTSLAATLRRHSQVHLSKPKEPKFFGSEYPRGWDWYAEVFAGAEGKKIRIDASTRYTSADPIFLATPQMISNYIEDPKFIYIVRHPLDRIVSHWRHYLAIHPSSDIKFNDIVKNETMHNVLISASKYYERISPYRKFFGDDQILCITLEDMLAEPRESLIRILEFLQVASRPPMVDRLLPNGAFRHNNPAGASGRGLVPKPEWDPKTRAEVIGILSSDSRRFLEYAGKPTDFWADL